MPLQRPRRIFRGSARPAGTGPGGLLRGTALILLALVVLGGAAMLIRLWVPANLFGRATAPSGHLSAEADEVAVVDGDTLRLHDTVLRLEGLTAPRRGQSCDDGAGASFDCGAAASAALAARMHGRRLSCELRGRDRTGLTVARCDAEGLDLGEAQVAAGWARAQGEAPGLAAAEAEARGASRGIWKNGAAPKF
ncbi:MAG TPA: thermonuclease family protein [Acetobacteraceae bacterium]